MKNIGEKVEGVVIKRLVIVVDVRKYVAFIYVFFKFFNVVIIYNI
jgi:hypothetical protein